MDLPIRNSLDEVLSQLTLTHPFPRKVLFWGDGAGGISSYVAGWMAGRGIDVILLDGANRFNPYVVSSFARNVLIPPEKLLRRIRIARAFTCHQMATLMGERLVSLLHARTVGAIHESPLQRPWVILLGPLTTFFDEDVPEREVRPLFERSLRKVEGMVMEGTPFFLFQPSVFPAPLESPVIYGGDDINKASVPNRKGGVKAPSFLTGQGRSIEPRRAYLTRSIFQFAELVWRISLDDEGPKMILEKGLIEKYPNNKHQIPNKFQLTNILNSKPPHTRPLPIGERGRSLRLATEVRGGRLDIGT
jgi:hypothetical protein